MSAYLEAISSEEWKVTKDGMIMISPMRRERQTLVPGVSFSKPSPKMCLIEFKGLIRLMKFGPN